MYRDVHLTALLRAVTNAIRHVSEWDDDQTLLFPYDLNEQKDKKQQLDSIRIMQKVLGYGVTERIHIAPAFDILAMIDGQWWSRKTPPDFGRFDEAVQVAAAQIIAEHDEKGISPTELGASESIVTDI